MLVQWKKKKSKWRSFAEACNFARSLKLSTQKEWRKYCKGELKGYPPKPKDIPASPQNIYKGKGWQGTNDWLGNGEIAYQRKGHRSFAEARNFARSLKLSSQKEWSKYYKGELKGYSPKPKDIPASPQTVYKDQDWKGVEDWLGYRPPESRPYAKARNFAHSLKLSSRKEWYKYCKGELKGYPPRPRDIPAFPHEVYRDKGWQGVGDWLGYRPLEWRPYAKARNFARSLKLSTQEEWFKYCKGELKGYPPKPKDIPVSPLNVYKGKGWQGMNDWLGNGKMSSQRKGHRPFVESRNFARSLKLSTQKEWRKYCKGELKGYPPRPRDIPAFPHEVYRDKGWQGWSDWLGYRPPEWCPYAKARNFARSLKLSTQKEWYKYCKGELKGYPPKPRDIPVSPQWVYKKGKGWQGMGDWLGKTR